VPNKKRKTKTKQMMREQKKTKPTDHEQVQQQRQLELVLNYQRLWHNKKAQKRKRHPHYGAIDLTDFPSSLHRILKQRQWY
jgi:hypothetical protein